VACLPTAELRVKAFLGQQERWLQVERLPGYAPELNLKEKKRELRLSSSSIGVLPCDGYGDCIRHLQDLEEAQKTRKGRALTPITLDSSFRAVGIQRVVTATVEIVRKQPDRVHLGI
jgi:hypothetical protein